MAVSTVDGALATEWVAKGLWRSVWGRDLGGLDTAASAKFLDQ